VMIPGTRDLIPSRSATMTAP